MKTYPDDKAFWTPGPDEEHGLTKREFFAAMAMQGVCSATDQEGNLTVFPKGAAEFAVQAADELIELLNKTKTL